MTPPDPAQVERFRADLAALLTHPRLARHVGAGPVPLALAVSGGPDSLGLLLLAHAAFPGMVEAATVDHGLRAGSADEARAVATVCADMGVPHETIRLGPFHEGRGLQAGLRDARYRDLGAWCGRRELRLLLTAHHAEDQAETLLMRLARGSGVAGLRGIRPWRELRQTYRVVQPHYVMTHFLLRPLLRWPRAELAGIVAAAGLAAADDPANDDPRFDRTQARRLLGEAEWLQPARLAAVASYMAEADDALALAASKEFSRRAIVDCPYVSLDPSELPPELLRRVVVTALDFATEFASGGGPDQAFPTGPELATLIARLQAGEHSTLGLVRAIPGPRWRFLPAPPRRAI